MDIMDQLMNPNCPLPDITVPGGQVSGFNIVESDYEDEDDGEWETTNYAEEYQKREEEIYAETSRQPKQSELSVVDCNDDTVSVDSVAVANLNLDRTVKVFTKYKFISRKTQELAIDSYKDEILRLTKSNEVVIIQGPTGCGKTTQVPQFILDDCKANGRPCQIVVTQPRRIAAISVARRVCEERGWAMGTVCGYQVGLESNTTSETLIQYVTTGVLLQKLINKKSLLEYTHVIIDEVHERNQDIDFLMIIVRRFLNTHLNGAKLILMSATFDTEQFAEYFKGYIGTSTFPAPVIDVSKNSKFTTQTFYAEQLHMLGKIPEFDFVQPSIDPSLYQVFVVLIKAFDKLDVIDPATNTRKIGNVLVFLPGILEIEEVHDHLTEASKRIVGDKIEWMILPLHSSITNEEQRRIFLSPAPGVRKIILSTNIAESSITVPDIVYVVDFCLTKTMVMDSSTQYQSLQLQWASHVNCIQRAGRVGRCADGRVYRLVTRKFYESCLSKTVLPEMLRAPLSRVVLASKLLELEEPPKAILALAMDPPNLANIDSTILLLKEVGGLTLTHKDVKIVSDGNLTFLGRVMANLPLDVYYSKLIILGYMFSCLEECIIMATGCTLNIFKSPFKERLKAYANRLQWADSSCSDLIAYLNLFQVWKRESRMGNLKKERSWAELNFVSKRALNEWQILFKEVTDRLKNMNIRTSVGPASIQVPRYELPLILKVVICGAFYPNYFTRSCDGGQIDEREAVKTLGGRDPCNTVYFTGFDSLQPGPLYTKRIKQLFADCSNCMQVSFENSSKIYVQFISHNESESVNIGGYDLVQAIPGKIRAEVYRAVRLRQITLMRAAPGSVCFKIPVLDKDRAWVRAKELLGLDKTAPTLRRPEPSKSASSSSRSSGSSKHGFSDHDEEEEYKEVMPVVYPPTLPSIGVQYITINISEKINAGHFWAHNNQSDTRMMLQQLLEILNSKELERVNPSSVTVGGLYATIYPVDKMYYRCKVISLNPFGGKRSIMAQIIFIDFGNSGSVNIEDLFVLPKQMASTPPQAMECYLSKIQPSIVANPKALWSDKANNMFYSMAAHVQLYAKVYSVVNGVVHLELYLNPNCTKYEDSLNYWLIKEGYAQEAEESFLSKENHEKRLLCVDNPDKAPAFENEDYYPGDLCDVEPPSIQECRDYLMLKGPYSPLEMRLYSAVASGTHKAIHIEGGSVNAVLLDSEPQDPHERLVVAAHIGQSHNGNALSLRHTTVMPNLHGFPLLMSLLFSPTMELKPTADGSRIGAVLCGLGAHEKTHKPLFAAHDICLTLDTDLTEDDVNKINELRYWMNAAMHSMECVYRDSQPMYSIEACQRDLKNFLFSLLKSKRTSVERTSLKYANIWGKSLYDAILLRPGTSESKFPNEIWPLHWGIKLDNAHVEESTLQKNQIELEEIALNMRPSNEIICRICNITLYSAGQLRLHLTSLAHSNAQHK